MKVRILTTGNAIVRALVDNGPTLLFVVGLFVLCAGVSQWSKPAAMAIAGVTLMVIGALPAYLSVFRGIHRTRKDS